MPLINKGKRLASAKRDLVVMAMSKLIKILLIATAIICLMVVVFLALINSSFHFQVLDTEYEYVNVNKVDGMRLTIVIKTFHPFLTDPLYSANVYVNHDWKNPIKLIESEEPMGSKDIKVKALGVNKCQVIFHSYAKLLIWKTNGQHPAYDYEIIYLDPVYGTPLLY